MAGFCKDDRRVLLLLAVGILFFMVSPFVFSESVFRGVFAENGLVETVSFWGWLGASAFVVALARPFGLPAFSFAVLCAAFAAREADWQKKFTSDGFTKINYYQDGSIPLTERLIAGAVFLVLLAALLYAGFLVVRFLFFRKGWNTRTGVWILAAGALLVTGKILDRLPAEAEKHFGIEFGDGSLAVLLALEEGMEALTPFLFIWSVWLGRSCDNYVSRKV